MVVSVDNCTVKLIGKFRIFRLSVAKFYVSLFGNRNKMRYVAAYLLAVMGGNEHPDSAAIKKILSAVGVDFDEAKAKKVIESLKGKNTEELITKGKEKLASVPSAAAVAAPAAAAAAPAGKGAEPKKEEKKKEEKKEESEDEDMGFGLFD